MRVKLDLRELQYRTDPEDSFSICVGRFKGRQELPFKRGSTANTPASRITAPLPFLSIRLYLSITATFSSGSELTIPIVKWQEDDQATFGCFARFENVKRCPVEGRSNVSNMQSLVLALICK